MLVEYYYYHSRVRSYEQQVHIQNLTFGCGRRRRGQLLACVLDAGVHRDSSEWNYDVRHKASF